MTRGGALLNSRKGVATNILFETKKVNETLCFVALVCDLAHEPSRLSHSAQQCDLNKCNLGTVGSSPLAPSFYGDKCYYIEIIYGRAFRIVFWISYLA